MKKTEISGYLDNMIKSSLSVTYADFYKFIDNYNDDINSLELSLKKTIYMVGSLIDFLKDHNVVSDEFTKNLLNEENMEKAISLADENLEKRYANNPFGEPGDSESVG